MDNVHLFLDAARYDEIDTLKQLLADGFDINSKDEYGNTALHNAAANGNLEIVDYLIENGIKCVKNDSGNTPLHRAVLLRHLDIVLSLLNAFDDLDVLEKNSFGKSAVDIAFQSGDENLINSLLNHKSAAKLDSSVGYEDEEIDRS